jgi:hypothetical protein
MKSLNTLTDPVYIPKEKYSGYDKFWLRFINDPRDLPFVYLLTAINLLVIPVAILLYTPLLEGWQWWPYMFPISISHSFISRDGSA